jgi:hypothetical protein
MVRSWILGAACGVVWWVISMMAGATAYGILGTYPVVGAVAGAITGVAIAAISKPVYRLPSPRALLWYSPLSVYVAIAIYGAIVFVIRWWMRDFQPQQTPWAVGLESIEGMWWGVTFAGPVAIPVHLIAYANHRLLRRLTAHREEAPVVPIG